VIGADGYHSVTRKSIACKSASRKFFIAMEVKVPKDMFKDFKEDEVLIDIGVVKKATDGIFPKGSL